MLSALGPASVVTRSSLEQMLDSIRQRDEQSKDVPPALPARPVKRGRLPSARRSLPVDFKIGGGLPEFLPGDEPDKVVKVERPPVEDKKVGFRSGIFGSKRRLLSKVEEPAESPYAPDPGSTERKMEEAEVSDAIIAPSTPSSHVNESGCNDTIGCVLKETQRELAENPKRGQLLLFR